MNPAGLAAAVAAFAGVWFGHVAVRKIEYLSPGIGLPVAGFVLLGTIFEWMSLRTTGLSGSVALGILGVTFLWDGVELVRQQRRVIKGHAPANPHNPRHARLLARYPAATTANLLQREPSGQPMSAKAASPIRSGVGQ